MNKDLLVRTIGFPATVIHGDALVLDRWNWLKRRLPKTCNGERLIDIGCGTGAFTIGAALRGYRALGLSWDRRNQRVAGERAAMCRAGSARFEVCDVRRLGERPDLLAAFDVAICFETIEHILDDLKLMRDISACLKPGGRFLLTTPNFLHRPITPEEQLGPYVLVEDGGHVRRGYTPRMLEELCDAADLRIEQISYCSGFWSQKVTFVQRRLSRIHPLFGWASVQPLRLLPLVLDRLTFLLTAWPGYSICMEAYKQRHPTTPSESAGSYRSAPFYAQERSDPLDGQHTLDPEGNGSH